MKPRVLSIGYGRHLFQAGNPERFRMELCAAKAESYRMIIFTAKADGLSVTNGAHNLMLYPTNSRFRLLMPVDAFLIARKIIKTHGSHTVTTQDPFEPGAVGYILKMLYKVPLIIQEHGDVFSTPYWRKESFFNQVRYLWGKSLLLKADLVRVVSMRMEEFYKKMGVKRIATFPVAVDTKPLLVALPSNLSQYFSSQHFVFLSVARFVPQKNLKLLIDAFTDVNQKHPNARLLLVGSGKEAEVLKEQASKAVVFLPWSSDVAGLMKASNVYVLSSNYEGWGRVLIEAMVCQLPIVTTDVGCAGEVIKNNTHGLIVSVNDKKALSAAMMRLLEDKELYTRIKQNLQTVNVDELPGTHIEEYGKNWIKTVTIV